MKNIKKIMLVLMLVFITVLSFSQQKNQNIKIIKSTNEVLIFDISVPEFQLNEIKTDRYGLFHKINFKDNSIKLKGAGRDYFSTPEVPMLSTLVALPISEDSDVNITIKPGEARKYDGIRIYPVQNPLRDTIGAKDNEEFEFNEDIYYKSTVKHGIASFDPINPDKRKKMKEENIYNLVLNLVDYIPEKKYMVSYSSFRVEIQFKGDNRYFSSKRKNTNQDLPEMDSVDNWYELRKASSYASVINSNILASAKYQLVEEIVCYLLGARFIIVTDPEFLPAAFDLKNHKESRGISTIVVSTDVTGTSKESIRSYLMNAYFTWFVRPKWVLLMGDAEFIPTHYSSSNTWDNADNAGDIYYGQFGIDDTAIPVFGIGRFPVDTLAQANTMVDNVISFENNPPSSFFLFDNPFYYRLHFAAEFQDYNFNNRADRWFAETSEHIRNHMLTEGLSINRIYATYYAANNPLFWNDGTPIPDELKKPGFAWDGNNIDIIDSVNNGTSLLYHRDHGNWEGWGTPAFDITDLSSISITNNEYPVVYSINCASGIFDNETVNPTYTYPILGLIDPTAVYWAESFVRKPDGAIAVIGDTRSSSTYLNNDLAKGLFDATWPDYLGYGPAVSIKKLGDILNHAKGYLKSLGIYSTAELRQELTIYNLLGDPTLELRSRNPRFIQIEIPILYERELIIPVLFPELEIDPGYMEGPPIFAAAFIKEKGSLKLVGRALLEQKDFQDKTKISIKLTEDIKADEIIVVVSGNEIITEKRIISTK